MKFLKLGNSECVFCDAGSKRVHRIASSKFSVRWLFSHLKQTDDLYVVSVVPKVHAAIKRSWKRKSQLIVLNRSDLGDRFAYERGLGLDRCLNIFAVRELFPMRRPKVVVDLGTAITVDVLDQKGRHRGGWILSGPLLNAKALHEGTAQLPFVAPHRKNLGTRWGSSTRECLALGQIQYLAALVERAEQQAFDQFRKHPKLILTGGWSAMVEYPKGIKIPDLWKMGMQAYILKQRGD